MQPAQKYLSISEAAHLLGISAKTLRRWDKSGKVKINRTPNGDRIFTLAEIEALRKKVSPFALQNSAVDKKELVSSEEPKVNVSISAPRNTKFIVAGVLVLLIALIYSNFILALNLKQNNKVLGVETFLGPVVSEEGPLGGLISKAEGIFNIFKGGSLVVPLLGKNELETPADLNVQGKAHVASDIEGLGNLNIKGTATVGKLVTPVVDPYLIENDGTVQSTLEIKTQPSVLGPSDIVLEPGGIEKLRVKEGGPVTVSTNLNIGGGETIGGNLSLSSTSPTISIGDTGKLSITDGTNTLLTLSDNGTTGNLETTGDMKVDGNITLSGAINSDTLNSTSLVFAGSSPSIYPSTTNTSISLNGNGTGGVNLQNGSTGDINFFTTSNKITSSGNLTIAGAYNVGGSSGKTISACGSSQYLGGMAVTGGIITTLGNCTTVSSSWSGLTAPTSNLSLSMSGYTTTLTYNAATGASTNLFNLTDTTNNTGTGYLMNITTAAGSTLKPFHVQTTGSVDAITVIANGNTGIGTNSPGSQLQVSPQSTTTIGEIIKAQASQSADLWQIQNSLAAVMAKVDSLGNLTANTLTSTVSQGTAPLTVTSTTVVANLNASAAQEPQPNLVLNSDFGRRNKWMTFMPETFTDTAGWAAETGSLGTVGSNILTAGTAGSWRITGASGMVWRDVRWSASFKAVDTTTAFSEYYVYKWVNATNWIRVRASSNSNQLAIDKDINGVTTRDVVNAATSLGFTVNQWYWIELEAQGTTYIAKLYRTGTTTAGTTKASSTLDTTISVSIADSAVTSGSIALGTSGIGTAGQFGGLATGDGGVYVEGWGPESWPVTFDGTIGGQAIGFDETADSGPLGKQWALKAYIPATNRRIYSIVNGPDGGLNPQISYTGSVYVKTSGKTGSNALVGLEWGDFNSAVNTGQYNELEDSGETSWTQKTGSMTSLSTSRRVRYIIQFNRLSTAAGTAWFMLPQIEQGTIATPWRNAPADDDALALDTAYQFNSTITSSSANYVEVDSRDLAANVFLPWDANVLLEFEFGLSNTLGGFFGFSIDGVNYNAQIAYGGTWTGVTSSRRFRLSAGKHRIAALMEIVGGTNQIYAGLVPASPVLQMTATRGKFDLAEEYEVSDNTIGAGDVVRLSQNSNVKSQNEIERTDKGYDGSVLGIVSTDPGVTLGNFNLNGNGTINSELSYQDRYSRTNLRPVALSGRVPVKVTNENGYIHRGDFLTSSALYPGFAMKAIHAGRVIGIAMDDFPASSSNQLLASSSGTNQPEASQLKAMTGTVMVFVNLSWYDPDVYLTDSGSFVINKSTSNSTVQLASNGQVATPSAIPNSQFTISNSNTKETIDRTGAFNNLFVANLKVGKLDATEISQLTQFEQRIRRLELATQSAVLSASISGLLDNNPISSNSAVLSTLTVQNKTLLNDLGITGKVTAGLLSIDGLSSSITSLGDLKFNVAGGVVTLNKNGDLTIQKLNVSPNSIGRGVIKAGTISANVSTTAVTDKSEIFVTLRNKDSNQPPVIATQSAGIGFTVEVEQPVTSDVEFSWWIVN